MNGPAPPRRQPTKETASEPQLLKIRDMREILSFNLSKSESETDTLSPTRTASGFITVQQVDPAELSPGEFVTHIRRGVEAGARLVVIDSLNGYLNSMPGEKYLNSQLHELSSYLDQQGVLTFLVLAQHGLVSAPEAPVDLSYLSDTVITLRYFEALGEIKQAVAVIKKRSGRHEKTIREFKLETGKGIRVGEPIREFQGVLSGVLEFRGNEKTIMRPS